MRPYSKFWKESASLLILARNNNENIKNNLYNYNVLACKRSGNASFMPNGIVFPGGLVEKSDETQEWLKLYKKFNINENQLTNLTKITTNLHNRPEIFKNYDKSLLQRDLSLRITAIRETFEELGVLICRNRNEVTTDSKFAKFHTDFDIKKWQKLVHSDSNEFLNMCNELDVIPDIWNLYEWSAWLTPTTIGRKRFETVFYLVALEEQPHVVVEKNEMEESLWETPESLINSYLEEKLWLPPPQLYELARLANIKTVEDVIDFCKKHNLDGTTLFYPIQYRAKDGLVHVLPGDSLYPKDIDLTKTSHQIDEFKDKSVKELRVLYKDHHRTEHIDMFKSNFVINIKQFNRHLNPLLADGKTFSKL